MHRRTLLIGAAATMGLGARADDGAPDGGAAAAPAITFSLAQIQALVDAHFPMDEGVTGVIDLQLQAPRLRLLPEINRLGALQQARLRAPPSTQWLDARFDLQFALYYDATEHALYATTLKLRDMQLGGLQGQAVDLMRQYADGWLQRSLVEVALYRLTESDQARMKLLGVEPGPITVTPAGVRVALVPQRP